MGSWIRTSWGLVVNGLIKGEIEKPSAQFPGLIVMSHWLGEVWIWIRDGSVAYHYLFVSPSTISFMTWLLGSCTPSVQRIACKAVKALSTCHLSVNACRWKPVVFLSHLIKCSSFPRSPRVFLVVSLSRTWGVRWNVCEAVRRNLVVGISLVTFRASSFVFCCDFRLPSSFSMADSFSITMRSWPS
jgi:hypothetical protein